MAACAVSDIMTSKQISDLRYKLESQDQVKQWRFKAKELKEEKMRKVEMEQQREKKRVLGRQTKRVQDDLARKSDILRMQRLLKAKEEEADRLRKEKRAMELKQR